jgi:hypothetical protein
MVVLKEVCSPIIFIYALFGSPILATCLAYHRYYYPDSTDWANRRFYITDVDDVSCISVSGEASTDHLG